MINTKLVEKYKELFSSTPALFLISWNGSDEFSCCEGFEKLTGYSQNELSEFSHNYHSLITNENGEKVHDLIMDIFSFKSSDTSNVVYEIKTKNEKRVWLKETPLVSETNNIEKFCLIEDVTDYQASQLKLKDDLNNKTKLNDSKDKLISIIAHDLRAPFTSLLGFSEILLNEPHLGVEERIEYLQYIHDASKLQLDMVNHLLDWTRLQTGTMKFEPQRLEIKDVIDNCVSVLTGIAIRKEIQINVDVGKDIFVHADERLISQVVTNLLSNAVKFTKSGKKINVVANYFKDSLIEIVVKDEGKGISEKNKSKLFNIESKFSETGTAGEKGSGLGLTLVKEIVEKHGGDIWFYSELEKGSEFHFTLPKAEDTIVIVEEHEELRSIYREVFENKLPSYKLEFTKNGFEALNLILKNTPAILVTYHSMPLMNGIQLVSSLRKKDSHNKVDVIVMVDDLSEEEKIKYEKLAVKNFTKVNNSPEDLMNLLTSFSK